MIILNVTGQKLTVNSGYTVDGSRDYITGRATFSGDWNGMHKYAHFRKGIAEPFSVLLDSSGTWDKSAHVNLTAGIWEVWLHGTDGITVITTDVVKIEVKPTGEIGGDPFPEVTPSIGEQLVNIATAAAEKAETESGKAAGFATAAGNAATAAAGAASAAITAQGSAEAAAKAAELAANRFDVQHLKNAEISEDGNSVVFTHENGKRTKFAPKTGSDKPPAWNNIAGKPATFPPSAHTHDYNALLNLPAIPEAYDDTELRQRIKTLEDEPKVPQTLIEQVDSNTKNLARLWKLNQGISYEFETDDAAAYSKAIPSGAMEMDVHRIGGKSIVFSQLVNPRVLRRDGLVAASLGLTYHRIDDTSFSVKGTTTKDGIAQFYFSEENVLSCIKDHYYYLPRKFKGELQVFGSLNIQTGGSNIVKAAADGNNVRFWYKYSTVEGMVYDEVVTVNLFDLTDMGLEGKTEEELEQIIPNVYPPTESTIVSADVDEVGIVGRNLLDFDKISFYEYAEKASKENGTITYSVSAAYQPARFYLGDIEEGVYKVSFDVLSVSNSIAFQVSNYQYGNDIQSNNSVNKIGKYETDVIKVTRKTRMSISIYTANSSGASISIKNIQFEKGTTATPYKPYREPITVPVASVLHKYFPMGMNSAGNIYDYIDFENGVAVQLVGSVIFNGSENWVLTGTTTEELQGFAIRNDSIGAAMKNSFTLCAGFPYSANESVANTSRQNNSTYGIRFSVSKAICPNGAASEWKSYLALNNKKFYYELSEPLITPIDAEDLEILQNIEVESGGSITFHQSADGICLPVPNSEEYLIALNEVTA